MSEGESLALSVRVSVGWTGRSKCSEDTRTLFGSWGGSSRLPSLPAIAPSRQNHHQPHEDVQGVHVDAHAPKSTSGRGEAQTREESVITRWTVL